jgi:hypothetical protein
MKALIVIDEAESDIDDAFGIYLPRSEAVADSFLAAIGAVLNVFRTTQLHFQESTR